MSDLDKLKEICHLAFGKGSAIERIEKIKVRLDNYKQINALEKTLRAFLFKLQKQRRDEEKIEHYIGGKECKTFYMGKAEAYEYICKELEDRLKHHGIIK